MDKYLSRNDCTVVRDHEDYPASVVLIDCDGEVVRVFDEDWTDDQIFAALAFANDAYAAGVKLGEWRKAQEICKVFADD